MSTMIKHLTPIQVPSININTEPEGLVIMIGDVKYIGVERDGELHLVNEAKRKLWEMASTLKKL